MITYKAHIRSQAWRDKRAAVVLRSEGICEWCKRRPVVDVHHLTYDRLGEELPGDLLGVCRQCHEDFHRAKIRERPNYMEVPSNVGCSDHSPYKQQILRAFYTEHACICREIAKKHRWDDDRWEYLYMDLFAGPGYLPNYPDIKGSPLIALETIGSRVPHLRALAFEEIGANAESLASRAPGLEIFVGRFQDHAPGAVKRLDPSVKRSGLIYADPNTLSPKDTSLFDVLKELAGGQSYFCDMLLHIPATTWKRVDRADKAGRRSSVPGLVTHLESVGKKYIKVSCPVDRQQWTFALLTNFAHPGFGRSNGWYDSDSDHGRAVLDRITMTAEELSRRGQISFLFPVV